MNCKIILIHRALKHIKYAFRLHNYNVNISGTGFVTGKPLSALLLKTIKTNYVDSELNTNHISGYLMSPKSFRDSAWKFVIFYSEKPENRKYCSSAFTITAIKQWSCSFKYVLTRHFRIYIVCTLYFQTQRCQSTLNRTENQNRSCAPYFFIFLSMSAQAA